MNLVTGATGLLGSHLVLDLISRGEKVRALVRPQSSRKALMGLLEDHRMASSAQLIEWFEGDVMDILTLEEAMLGCTHVYHCAAIVSYHRKDRNEMYRINVEGTANVVNAALAHGSISLGHVSSIAAIGRTGKPEILHEDSPWHEDDHTSHYARTKYLSEMEVWRGIQEGLQAVILNAGFIIGPGDFSRSSGAIFSRIHQGVPFYPPGGTGFVSAGDAAFALIELMKGNHFDARYIAVAENLRMQSVFEMISAAFGKKAPTRSVRPIHLQLALIGEQLREWITGRKASVTREVIRNLWHEHAYSNERIRQALGGFEFQPIKEAVRITADSFIRSVK